MDEFGNGRKVEEHVTSVHKPLASASEISKYHDAFIFEESGAFFPDTAKSRNSMTRVPSTVRAL